MTDIPVYSYEDLRKKADEFLRKYHPSGTNIQLFIMGNKYRLVGKVGHELGSGLYSCRSAGTIVPFVAIPSCTPQNHQDDRGRLLL